MDWYEREIFLGAVILRGLPILSWVLPPGTIPGSYLEEPSKIPSWLSHGRGKVAIVNCPKSGLKMKGCSSRERFKKT